MKTFDRKDGNGADWRLMLESLYQARFKIADEKLGDNARRKIMRHVHEGAEVRMAGGYADGTGASSVDPDPDGPVAAPSNAGAPRPPTPRPPR